MVGIDIAALLTSLLALAAFGTLIWQIGAAEDRPWLFALVLLGLPFSMLIFYAVRLPVDQWLTKSLGETSPILIGCKLWYAPLTEELAKLLPLAIALPFFGRKLNSKNQVAAAIALGLGFAVGEFWLVAGFIRDNPQFQTLPFYQFGGYVNERLATCIAHSGFTVLALWGIQRSGGRAALGILAAMTLHFLFNFPIFLMNFNFGGLGNPVWGTIVSVWLLVGVISCGLLLGIMHSGWKRVFEVVTATKIRCPECGEIYRQPLLACNFGTWRYEPCGACHKWHWVSLKDIQ